MPFKIAVIMDPMASINAQKDSTLALMLAAQARQCPIFYTQSSHVYYQQQVMARGHFCQVADDPKQWVELQAEQTVSLQDFEVILMRQDPPFNQEYIYTTYYLDHLVRAGCLVVNAPQALRNMNEKFATTFFPAVCPETLVSRDVGECVRFCQQHQAVVAKPLDFMGGQQIFYVHRDDVNVQVILTTLTQDGQRTIMLQRYLKDIIHGDKRVILIDGEPQPEVLVRVPTSGEFRGNLAQGARATSGTLTERDREICQVIGAELAAQGLLFVGVDIIGGYLTEINVTSPTGLREIQQLTGVNLAEKLIDTIETKLTH